MSNILYCIILYYIILYYIILLYHLQLIFTVADKTSKY